jgi:hypothetical protein
MSFNVWDTTALLWQSFRGEPDLENPASQEEIVAIAGETIISEPFRVSANELHDGDKSILLMKDGEVVAVFPRSSIVGVIEESTLIATR